MIFALFIEECHKSFDPSTSQTLWKLGFFTLDVLLLVVMPIALLREIFASESRRKRKKKAGHRLLTGVGCCCFLLIFLVDGFIFNTYLKAPTMS